MGLYENMTEMLGNIISRTSDSKHYDWVRAVSTFLDGPGGGSAGSTFNTVAAGASGSGRLIDMTRAQILTLVDQVTTVGVLSLKDQFVWDATSTLTADQISVVSLPNNPVAAGRFIRLGEANPFWLAQVSYDINPVSGNDENSGLTGFPVKHYYEIVKRWGTNSPILNHNLTLTWLLADAAPFAFDDPVVFTPVIGVVDPTNPAAHSSPSIQLVGIPNQIGTGNVFTRTSAKNRATNTPLAGTFATAIATDLLIRNDTAGGSIGWNPNTGSNQLCQPFAAAVLPTAEPIIPFSTGSVAENDAWNTGDTVTWFSLPKVWLVKVAATLGNLEGEGLISVHRIMVPENYGAAIKAGDDPVILGDGVQASECIFQKQVFLDITVKSYVWASAPTIHNCLVDGGIAGGARLQAPTTQSSNVQGFCLINGGALQSQSTTGTGTGSISLVNVWLDSDIILKSSTLGTTHMIFDGVNFFGAVNILGRVLAQSGGCVIDCRTKSVLATNVVWGAGSTSRIDAGRGQVLYPSGAGAAAACFAFAGSLHIGGQTLAFLGRPSDAAMGAGNKTISAANLDTDLGTTLGSYFVPGGGSISNGTY